MARKMSDAEKERQKRKAVMTAVKGYNSPDFEKLKEGHEDYQRELAYTFNYANYMYEAKDHARHAEKFFGQPLKGIPDWEFMALGVECWIINNGAFYPQDKQERVRSRIQALVHKYEKPSNDDVPKAIPKETATGALIGELNGLLDDIHMGIKERVRQPAIIIAEHPKADLSKVKAYFQAILASIPDEEFDSEKTKQKEIAALTIILNDMSKSQTEKPARAKKARKPKKIVPSKMVRKLKYLKEFPELQLKSIMPEHIVGAQVLWVFNTKTRKLGKYVAADETGLFVKGSTILNYNEAESQSKKLRKPPEVLAAVLRAGKVEQRKLLDNVKATASPLNGRINNDTILVRV